MEKESICQEAHRLVSGNRGADYGHPLDDFSKTARFWSVILGVHVTPQQVGLCMVALKLSRQLNKHKRDNLTDGAGYLQTVAMIEEELERRAHPTISGHGRAEGSPQEEESQVNKQSGTPMDD